MFKNSKHLYLVYAVILISFFALLPVSFATSSTSWQELGSTFPFNYTSATSNIQNGNVQLVVGFVNGVIEYYNPSTQTWINIPSPAPKGGTAVTALWCDWNNTINADGTINSNVPDVLAGYADGSVWYYKANQNGSGTWSSLGTPNSNEQVTKFGGISIDSSNNLTGCNAESAIVPPGAVTPADYTNKQLWTYSDGCSFNNLANNILADAIDTNSPGWATSSELSYINNGSPISFSLSNSFENACSIDGDDYFFAGQSGDTNIYSYWGSTVQTISTGESAGPENYPYISGNKNSDGSVGAIVADNAIRYFTASAGVANLTAQGDLWSDPDNTSFNGINVYWSNNYPVSFIAGLINGDLVWTLPNNTTPTVISAPPNFSSDYQDNHSMTFASAQVGAAVEIFNNDGNCYIYTMTQPIIVPPVANPITLNVYVSGNLTTGTYNLAQVTNVPNGLYSITETPSSNQIYIDDTDCEYALPYTLGTLGGPETYTAEYQVIAPYGARASSTFTVVLDPSIIANNVSYGINTFRGTFGSVNIADYVNGCTDGSTYSITFPCAFGTNVYGSTIQVSNVTDKTNYTGSYTVQNQYGYTENGSIDVYGYFFVGP